jgi:hypothetical protein
MKKIFFILFALCSSILVNAQELDCRISINTSKIQGTSTDQTLQRALQQALYEFVNNTQWTNNVFSRDERIECNIQIIVDEQISSEEFKGSIQITSSRPVYGTSYLSPLLNYRDNDFQFKFNEFETLEFNPNTFSSNLTAVVTYYCFILLGLDYDTFGPSAGNTYFQQAERIVQSAQNSQEPGWKAFENLKNRYWLTENLLSNQYSGIREFLYTYHRLGLDKLVDKPAEGRASIETAIEALRGTHRRRPNSFLMSLILNIKSDEIVSIFSEGFPDEKARVVNMMKEIDPANSSKYDKILRSED